MADRSDTPTLAGRNHAYLETRLRNFRSGERQHAPMNALARDLTDEQSASLAAWFTTIRVEVTGTAR